MLTEITDHNARQPAGWIFYDAECRFCVAGRRRWGPIFERRGFVWLPLQTPGTAERLGVTPERLLAEMWLLTPGSPPCSGVNAWMVLIRHVGWLRPLATVLGLPGIRRLADAVYRWTARHRHCLAGQCRLPPPPPSRRHRHTAFLELP
jgi:predicted DCC family thiol-disulfide oxidoreductase YuxK